MLNIYRIPSEKIRDAKAVLENPDVVVNMWARNGYIFRDAKTLGLDKKCSYVYAEGPQEFFEKHEKELTSIEGIEKVSGEEFGKVKQKINDEQNNALSGVGSIFG
ncbi:MAG: hypothetical protein QXO69_01305 [archaeon]